MRRAEPLEPGVAAALEAIDGTLAGDPVDPEHAELAELALILRDERPRPDAATAAAIDQRVRARIEAPRRTSRLRPQWVFGPVAALAAVALVVVIVSGGGSDVHPQDLSAAAGSSSASAASAPATKSAGSSASSSTAASPGTAAGSSGSSHQTPLTTERSAAPSSAVPAPTPSTTGRQIVQSAQLALTTTPSRVDAVAQEVFDVVDSERGVVSSSHVTSAGTNGGGADFQLSVPSTVLQQTMAALSQLPGAHVVSRTDDTSDITGQVGGAGRALANERALRRALLRQLAAATTPGRISALQAKLGAVDATIGRDESQLNGLHRQVQYSQVMVTIATTNSPVGGHSGGLTLHRALHDAERVLVVVAGVALIALAALLPLGLLVAVVLWVAMWIRRRRREAALDLM